MDAYYVNKNAQSNGDHEVHKSGCPHMPEDKNLIDLGAFDGCQNAVREARKHYDQVDGCGHCCEECHRQ